MKRIHIYAVLLGLASIPAQAGVRIETVTRNVATGKEGAVQKIYVQGGALRTETSDGDIVLFRDDTIYQIDNADRSYRAMDKATMQKLGGTLSAAMQKMQAQLAQLPPAQRAQIEQLTGRLGGAGQQPDVYETVDTGRSDTVAGHSCRNWQIKRNGAVDSEVCVVPYASLGGKEDIQALLKKMSEMFESLAQSVPQLSSQLGSAMHAYTRINGYPVRTRDFTDGKPDSEEDVLKTWQEAAIPASMFEVPAGYKRVDIASGLN